VLVVMETRMEPSVGGLQRAHGSIHHL